MNRFRPVILAVLLVAYPALNAPSAQTPVELGNNAALRYWAAFAEMQDSVITEAQAHELNRILDGTAPYNDLNYGGLVEKNRAALAIMGRGTALPYCNWGVDYELGPNAPVDYVRKALELGRLNVLYAFHLALRGNDDGAVRALSAGIRFSRDVANGGTLFATLVAKNLMTIHLRAMAFVLHVGRPPHPPLSSAQQAVLEKAVDQLGAEGLDWQSAIRREMAILKGYDSVSPAALARITSLYEGALDNPSLLPKLQRTIAAAPPPLSELIPNPKCVIESKEELATQIQQMRSMLKLKV